MSLDLVLHQAVLRGQPEEFSARTTDRLHATCNLASGDERDGNVRSVTAIITPAPLSNSTAGAAR